MSLAILKRKANTKSQSGNARTDPPGSNTMARKSNHIFDKVSNNTAFSINGSSRHSHYIGRGSHRATSTTACKTHTTNIKTSVATNSGARRNAILTRSNHNVVQPDSNFPENDSQGIYIFKKKLKHDCVTTKQGPTDRCGNELNTNPEIPECSELPKQNCRGFQGSVPIVNTPYHKDFSVYKSYDDYLSKSVIPECAIIDENIYPKKINNITKTNSRCGRF